MTAALIWSVLSSRLAGPIASAVAVALACFLVAAVIGQAGLKAEFNRLSKDRDAWKAAAGRWEASARALRSSFDEAEAIRVRETSQARLAADEARRSCDARVVSARRSARAIESIVTQEVAHDANDCPVRRLVPRERLRDALAPAN